MKENKTYHIKYKTYPQGSTCLREFLKQVAGHSTASVHLQSNKETIQEIRFFPLHPLTSSSDNHLISPYNMTSESHINVTRTKEMITH